MSCSKGTYIRTLCHDIGERLGTGGCMEQLVRTRAGSFDISGSHRIEEVAEAAADGRIEEYLIPLDSVFEGMRKITVKDGMLRRRITGILFPPGLRKRGQTSALAGSTEYMTCRDIL